MVSLKSPAKVKKAPLLTETLPLPAPSGITPLAPIAKDAKWFGYFTTVADQDGVIRHTPAALRISGRYFPSPVPRPGWAGGWCCCGG